MADLKKYLHAKFHIDKNINAMDAFIFSEDKERVDSWKGDKEENASQATVAPETKDKFTEISNIFERSME